MRNTLSIKSMISARTILISSIMISSSSRNNFEWFELYFKVFLILRGLYWLSFGRRGWKGMRKKLCSVLPPALMAAIPVGASITCFFFVFCYHINQIKESTLTIEYLTFTILNIVLHIISNSFCYAKIFHCFRNR
mgnify:CR=1 FL=1